MHPSFTTDSVYRLSDCNRDLIESLSDLGGVYFQARNRGGGLGKRIDRFDAIMIDGMEYVFDADNGIGFSFDEWIAVHVGYIATGQFSAPAIDFEFNGFPAGMSFHEFPGMSEPGAISSLIQTLPRTSLSTDALNDWRKVIETDWEMCPCCHSQSEKRANAVDLHPIYTIFRHAIQNQIQLEARILSDHVDMTSTFVPEVITSRNGFLILTNERCDHALHLDMRWVHSLAIDRENLDGVNYSTLKIFDMYGNLNFEFMCENPAMAKMWRQLCEVSSGAR